MMRLFVGLELPLAQKQQLAPLCAGLREGRWVEPDNQHITLAFLGNVDEGSAEDLHDTLLHVTFSPFELELKGLGAFEHRGQPKQVWAGVQGDLDPLHALQKKILSTCEQTGLKPERRKYIPHVTLCRLKADAAPSRIQYYMEGNNTFQGDPFEVSQFCLFQSHLTRHGADYEILARYG